MPRANAAKKMSSHALSSWESELVFSTMLAAEVVAREADALSMALTRADEDASSSLYDIPGAVDKE